MMAEQAELERRLRGTTGVELRRRLDQCRRCRDDAEYRQTALQTLEQRRGSPVSEAELLRINEGLLFAVIQELERRVVKVPFRCPHCGVEGETALTDISGADIRPGPGDITICQDCGEWAEFGPDLELKVPSDEVQLVIGTDPQCRLVREAWLRMRA